MNKIKIMKKKKEKKIFKYMFFLEIGLMLKIV